MTPPHLDTHGKIVKAPSDWPSLGDIACPAGGGVGHAHSAPRSPCHDDQVDDSHLPFVDVHAIPIAAPRDVVWAALESYVFSSLQRAERNPVTWILGARPRAGFRIQEQAPPTLLTLAGRHRFSKYRLVFELVEGEGTNTELRATTFAAFPGVHGRLYRALVIGTRGHVIGVKHLLHSVERISLQWAQ